MTSSPFRYSNVHFLVLNSFDITTRDKLVLSDIYTLILLPPKPLVEGVVFAVVDVDFAAGAVVAMLLQVELIELWTTPVEVLAKGCVDWLLVDVVAGVGNGAYGSVPPPCVIATFTF